MKHIILCTAIILTTTLNAFTQSGSLDKTFSNDGKQYYGDLHTSSCKTLAVQKDGKILAGCLKPSQNFEGSGSLIIRFNTDGSIDESFGDHGKVIVYKADGKDGGIVVALAVQPDDKILVCAIVIPNGNSDIGLIRLNTDGSFDNTFGDNGIVTKSIGMADRIGGMVLQPDGKIVVAGKQGVRENQLSPIYLVRFLANGHIDDSFGTEGIVLSNFGIVTNINAVTLQPDGKILIGGAYITTPTYFLVIRYNMDGGIDSSFGLNGLTKFTPPLIDGYGPTINSLYVQQDGKILGAGTAGTGHREMTVVRFDAAGFVDKSFGNNNGYAIVRIETGTGSAQSVFETADKKIIITGLYYNYMEKSGQDIAVAMFNENGTPDVSFGENGVSISGFDSLRFGPSPESGVGVIQKDGKIVVSGCISDNEYEFYNLALFRFIGSTKESEKYVRIKRWLHRHGFTWDDKPNKNISYYSIQRSANGNSFNELAKLFNHNNQGQYSYQDEAPLNGTNYYRLAAVSTSGEMVYSNIITIENTEANIKVYPNPVKNNLHIEGLSATQKTKLTITDFNGNTRLSAIIVSSTYNLNVAQLSKGNYLLKIENDGNVVMKHFLKE